MPAANLKHTKYYPFFDGLRCFAILWVLLFHAFYFFKITDAGSVYLAPIVKMIRSGFLGVDIFFVISGFLITGLLVDGLTTKINVRRFYIRRFFKIIPHYYITVVVGLIITAFTGPDYIYGFNAILSYFLFFNNYVMSIPILSHLWSIAIEEHFYFVLPLIMYLVCLLQKDMLSRKKLLAFIFLIFIIAGNMLRYHFLKLSNISPFPANYQMTHLRFDALFFGCLMKLFEPQLACAQKKYAGFIGPSAFLLSVTLFVYISLNFDHRNGHHFTLAYIASGLLIVSALNNFVILKAMIENKLLIFIGKNSYGIYLWHLLVLYPFKKLADRFDLDVIVIAILYIITSICIGIIGTQTIERYFLQLREKVIP